MPTIWNIYKLLGIYLKCRVPDICSVASCWNSTCCVLFWNVYF